jgi:hypothetical protein
MGTRYDDRRRAAIEAHEMWKVEQILGGLPMDDVDFDPAPKAQIVSASSIAPERVEWLWPGRIPLGMLTLFSGDPKLGKGLAAITVLAAVTRGGPLPGGGPDGPATAARGSAILLSAEDDPARTIVPRLRAAGADLDRVHILSTMAEPEFQGYANGRKSPVAAGQRAPTLSAEDLEAIERCAMALGDCRLIIFDPITEYLSGRNTDVRRALAPLRDMAARLGAAILLITHHNKHGAAGTNGKYRVLGQIAYVGVCRANFLFLQDPDDPSGRRRLMLDNGGNLAPRQPALVFVVHDEDGGGPGRVAAGDHRPGRRHGARPGRQNRQARHIRHGQPSPRLRGVVTGLSRRRTEGGDRVRASSDGGGIQSRPPRPRPRGPGRPMPSLGVRQGSMLPMVPAGGYR